MKEKGGIKRRGIQWEMEQKGATELGMTGSPSGNTETKRENDTRCNSQRGALNAHGPSANIVGLLLRLSEHS